MRDQAKPRQPRSRLRRSIEARQAEIGKATKHDAPSRRRRANIRYSARAILGGESSRSVRSSPAWVIASVSLQPIGRLTSRPRWRNGLASSVSRPCAPGPIPHSHPSANRSGCGVIRRRGGRDSKPRRQAVPPSAVISCVSSNMSAARSSSGRPRSRFFACIWPKTVPSSMVS